MNSDIHDGDRGIIQDGSVAGVIPGTPIKDLTLNNQNTVRRRSYLGSERKLSLQDLYRLIMNMGDKTLYIPFVNTQVNDWRNGYLGPFGKWSAIVLNTFLDMVDKITGAGLKDLNLLKRAEYQALDLMRQIGMAADKIADFVLRHDLDETVA